VFAMAAMSKHAHALSIRKPKPGAKKEEKYTR
jgi:hypothetical protein